MNILNSKYVLYIYINNKRIELPLLNDRFIIFQLIYPYSFAFGLNIHGNFELIYGDNIKYELNNDSIEIIINNSSKTDIEYRKSVKTNDFIIPLKCYLSDNEIEKERLYYRLIDFIKYCEKEMSKYNTIYTKKMDKFIEDAIRRKNEIYDDFFNNCDKKTNIYELDYNTQIFMQYY